MNGMVDVQNITFHYRADQTNNILSNVSLSVKEGEWLAIIGRNGSGKSTLGKLLIGLLQPVEGVIKIEGEVLNNNTLTKLRRKIGMVFQNPDNQFIGSTVQDDIAFSLENLNIPYIEMKNRIENALVATNLTNLRHYDPSRLSGGQKQRVALAGIIALQPSLLILDEAFVMLDPSSRIDLLNTLKKLHSSLNLTVISITHDMEEAAAADRILVLENGIIKKYGPPATVFINEENLPFAEKVRVELRKRGFYLPDRYMTEEELVSYL